jgi:hypothetical protein
MGFKSPPEQRRTLVAPQFATLLTDCYWDVKHFDEGLRWFGITLPIPVQRSKEPCLKDLPLTSLRNRSVFLVEVRAANQATSLGADDSHGGTLSLFLLFSRRGRTTSCACRTRTQQCEVLDTSGGPDEKLRFCQIGTPGHLRPGGLQKISKSSRKRGMTTLVIDESSLRAVRAQLTDEALVVDLVDGRSVSVPLVWYPRLLRASMKERQQFRLIGSGEGIHWELLDEDISVEGIVAGRRSMESAKSFRR